MPKKFSGCVFAFSHFMFWFVYSTDGAGATCRALNIASSPSACLNHISFCLPKVPVVTWAIWSPLEAHFSKSQNELSSKMSWPHLYTWHPVSLSDKRRARRMRRLHFTVALVELLFRVHLVTTS